MSEWAQQAAAQLWKDEAEQKQKDEVYARKRAQVLGEAPRLWEALKEVLFAEISAFNQHRPDYFKMMPNFQGLPAITIESEKASFGAHFFKEVPEIKFSTKHESSPYSGSTIQGSYDFEVDGGIVWFSSQRIKNKSVESVAHEMLDTIFQK